MSTKYAGKKRKPAPNTTKAWIYSVSKCCDTSTGAKSRRLYKVVWCEMYKSAGNKAGSKWVLDKGKDKKKKTESNNFK